MTFARIVAVLLSMLFVVPTGTPRSTYVPPRALWREFVATKVSDVGRSTPFSQASDIEVGLIERAGKLAPGRWIGWEAGCNSAGARIEVRPHRVDVGLISSTAVGCPPREQREDNWLWDFFEADPRWRLHGSQLTLHAGGRTIRLQPKR